MQDYLKLSRVFFENSADPMFISSVDNGRYFYANKAYRALTGFSNKEILQRSVIDDDTKLTEVNFSRMKNIAIKKDPFIRQTFLSLSSGEEIPIEKRIKYVNLKNQEFFFVIVRDMSRFKKLESDLKWMYEAIDTVSLGSSAGLWYWDVENDKSLFSSSYKDILGFDHNAPDDEVYKYWQENIVPEDKDFIFRKFREAIENKTKFQGEYRIKDRNGRYKYISTSGEALYNKDGKAEKVGGSVIDVTDLKKQIHDNEDLTKTLELFEFLVESSPNSLIIVDDEDCMFYANAAAHQKFHPYEKNELSLGKSIEFVTSKLSGINWQQIKNMVSESQSSRFECDFFDVEQGKTFALEITIYKILYKGRNCFCLILNDITKRKQFEIELQQSKERFRLAAQASKDGIWEWKIGEDTEYWSPRYYQLLGYNVGEIEPSLGNFMDSIHPDDITKVRQAVDDHIVNKLPYDVEARIRTKSGKYRWFVNHGHAEWDNKGDPIRIVGILRSIHSRKIREQQILETNKKLEEKNKELAEFAYIVSHDLKQPLQSIKYYSSFLLEDCAAKLNEEELQMLKKLKRQSEYMEHMIYKLLTFAESSDKKTFTLVNIQKIVESVISSLEGFLKENNAEIVIKNELPKIKCNETIIAEMFRNLIVNGVVYNKSKEKKVKIFYIPDVDYNCFAVADNGIGIDEKHHEKIFKPFQRLHRKEEYGSGSGFGLTLVKRIVEIHNGKIQVERGLKGGSVFKIFLPKSHNGDSIKFID